MGLTLSIFNKYFDPSENVGGKQLTLGDQPAAKSEPKLDNQLTELIGELLGKLERLKLNKDQKLNEPDMDLEHCTDLEQERIGKEKDVSLDQEDADKEQNEQVASTVVKIVSRKKMLNSPCRHALLDQALRIKCEGLFAKILLSSKFFLFKSHSQSIYRFGICVESTGIQFGFMGFTQFEALGFSLTIEQAIKLIQFLDPRTVNASVCLQDQENSPFLKLLELVNGKLELGFHYNLDIAAQLIETHWAKLIGLGCYASAVSPDLPVKKFDRQVFAVVESMDELRNILRHNYKDLTLFISHNFVNDDIDVIQNVGNIRKCNLLVRNEAALPVIRVLVRSCSSLKELTVRFEDVFSRAQLWETDAIINYIAERYNFYKQVVRTLSQIKITSIVDYSMNWFGEDFLLLQGWSNELMARADFISVRHETTVADNEDVTTKFTTEQKHETLDAKFFVQLEYGYVEVQVPEEGPQLTIEQAPGIGQNDEQNENEQPNAN